METGSKYTSISTRNKFNFFNLEASIPVFNFNLSKEFNYTEDTYALYLDFAKKFPRMNLKGGLRGEFTKTGGYSVTLDNRSDSSYLKIFPTLFIDYSVDEENVFNGFYGYRINRPDYWRLNPFRSYTSPYTFLEGNPALRPAYTHETEIGYTYKGNYNITFYYRHTNDFFSNITVQDNEQNIFYDTQQNLDMSIETGFYSSFIFKFSEKWESNNFIQSAFNKQKSNYLSSSYNYRTLFFYASSNHSFIISNDNTWRAEFNAWYASPTMQGIFRLGTTYDISLGFQKSIFDGRGKFRLALSDILKGTNYKVDVNYLNQENGFIEKNDTRILGLSFFYSFGNSKLKANRQRKTASEEERNRTRN